MISDAQVQSPSEVENDETQKCNANSSVKILEATGLLWRCALRDICLTALWLPLGALIFCYVTAAIFQADDIHETHCKVYNVVPSISAITGISPQRYVWRICVAFHLGPRLLIGSLYYYYHKERTALIAEEQARKLATKLGEACYWLNLLELLALTGVTYVSNRENYCLKFRALNIIKLIAVWTRIKPDLLDAYIIHRVHLIFVMIVHEKIFVVFLCASLVHMWCRARVGCVARDQVTPLCTNRLVWTLLFVALAATLGLIVFFLRHRLLCQPLAFTWFAVCEYILATSNMAFHALVVRDLPLHELHVLAPQRKND